MVTLLVLVIGLQTRFGPKNLIIVMNCFLKEQAARFVFTFCANVVYFYLISLEQFSLEETRKHKLKGHSEGFIIAAAVLLFFASSSLFWGLDSLFLSPFFLSSLCTLFYYTDVENRPRPASYSVIISLHFLFFPLLLQC